jgi:sugar lactone lactonase YvrE
MNINRKLHPATCTHKTTFVAIATRIVALAALSASLAFAQVPVFLPSVTAVAGSRAAGYTGDGGSALQAKIGATLSGTTMDPGGNIYITDTANSVIRRVDAVTGIISNFAGSGVACATSTGAQPVCGDTSPASSAKLNKPGAARYHEGSIYIVDTGDNRIRRVDLSTGIITTYAGGGSGTATPDSKTGKYPVPTAVSIPSPQGIAWDSLGNMYYSQQNGQGRVNKIDPIANTVSYFAGNATCCYSGDGGDPTKAQFNAPFGIVVDSQNNVYVSEAVNHIIRKITVATNTMSTYAGIQWNTSTQPTSGICAAATDAVGDGCPASQAYFGTLAHMSIDGNGVIYIADSNNNRVRKIQPGTNGLAGLVTTIAGTGAATSGPDGSYGLNTAVDTPWDAQLTNDGALMISERNIATVRVLRSINTLPATTVKSTSSPLPVLVLTQASTGTFSLPANTDFNIGSSPTCAPGVNVTGNVCATTVSFMPTMAGLRSNPLQFADSNGSMLQSVSGSGLAPRASLLPGLISTYAGTGKAGFGGDGSSALGALLNMPAAAASDTKGNLYIADTANNVIREILANGMIKLIAGTGNPGSTGDTGAATSATLNAPEGLAVDGAGNVYIADTGNNRIRYVDALSGSISTVAGTGAAGYSGDFASPLTAQFNDPTGLFLTPGGLLYVADTGNNVIRSIAFGYSPRVLTTAGASTPGFNGDGGPATLAQLQSPKGIALDANGNMFIADTGNNRIREVTSSGLISTIAGQQGGGYIGDGLASATELNGPVGLAVDSGGTIYIADTLNNRIRAISGGQIITVAGTGDPTSTGDNGTSGIASINGPEAVALDSTGNLLLLETAGNKVRRIGVATNLLAFKSLNPGESSTPQIVSLFNSGNLPLTLGSASVPAGYTDPNPTDCTSAPLKLNAGTSCNLSIVFQPPTLGSYNGTITLTDDSESAAGSTQTIYLTATSALVFTPSVSLPSSTTAGTSISATVTVTNPQTVYTGTLHFTSTDTKAVLPTDYKYVSSENGSHVFAITLKTAGPQCVTVTDTADSSVEASACTNVTANVAAAISVVSGDNQSANVGSVFASRFVTQVTDAFGNTVPNAGVTFTVVSNGSATGTFATSALSSDTETTDLSGFASSANLTSGASIGAFTVATALNGTPAIAIFHVSIVVLGTFTIVPTNTQVGPLQPAFSSTQTLTIVPSGGFSAPITLTCSAPSGITCTVLPTVVPFSNGQPSVKPTLSFQSQGGLRSAGSVTNWLVGFIVFLCVGLARRRRDLGALAIAILVFVALSFASGCSGTKYAPTTPDGSYTVTVTGIAQTVNVSTSVTYIIKRN